MAAEWLAERYPEIYFSLVFGGITPDNHPPAVQESYEAPLDEIEVVYLFGLDTHAAHIPLDLWLQKDKRRQLVILEDDLAAFAPLMEMHPETNFFGQQQIHLRYVNNWNEAIVGAARDFPCRRIEVIVSQKYAKTKKRFFARLRLELLRKTGMIYTYCSEALHTPLINTNFIHNAAHLANSFEANRLAGQFKGIPAVICGAGPSLGAAAEWLRPLEDRALVFAGGSAITALGNLGFTPHLALAIDPNHEEHERFKTNIVQEVPLLYGHRLRHQVFSTFNGPLGYIRSATGGSGEAWLEQKLEMTGEALAVDPEALSITTLALATAIAMGCSPIILIGVDLAYVDSKRYAPGILRDSSINTSALASETEHLERLVKRKNGQGKWVSTLVRWVMEAEALGNCAKKHPNTEFFNASAQGLRIRQIPFMPLEEWTLRYCQKTYDLRGRIHAEAESFRFTSITTQQIQDLFMPLIDSLHRLSQLMPLLREELSRLEREPEASLDSGKLLALNMQCEEEVAFAPLLDTIALGFDWLMRRQFDLLHEENTLEQRQRRLAFIQAKWEHIEKSIHYYLQLFEQKSSSLATK